MVIGFEKYIRLVQIDKFCCLSDELLGEKYVHILICLMVKLVPHSPTVLLVIDLNLLKIKVKLIINDLAEAQFNPNS
jgi:hypothetical protein